jgi:hypothetical protein
MDGMLLINIKIYAVGRSLVYRIRKSYCLKSLLIVLINNIPSIFNISYLNLLVILWSLTPPSVIFQLYRGSQICW